MKAFPYVTMIRLFCFFCLISGVFAQPEIVLKWSVDRCEIGEVVELKARMSSDRVSGFELKPRAGNSLEWIEHQRGVLRFENGAYIQEDTVIAQPTRSGAIKLVKMQAEVRDGEKLTELNLPVPPLEVSSYKGEKDDDFTPQPFPDDGVAAVAKRYAVWIAGGLLGLSGLVVFVMFSKRSKQSSNSAVGESLGLAERLKRISECETAPRNEIERLLEEKNSELSVELRQVMERVAYGRNVDWLAIRQWIRKEVAE